MGLSLHLEVGERWTEFKDTGIPIIIVVYCAVIAVSLATLPLGTLKIVYALSSISGGWLLSIFVFDSWGTVGGMLGIVVFYGIVVYGTNRTRRSEMSIFLLASTIAIGIVAGLLYDVFFDNAYYLGVKLISDGSSTIPVAGEGAVTALSAVGLGHLLKARNWRLGTRNKTISISLGALFLSNIVLSLNYVLFLQPAFVLTRGYNWQAHGIAFVLGVVAGMVYAPIRRVPIGIQMVEEALPQARIASTRSRKLG